ncbi:MAG: ATP-binding protein [Cyanobacteria bacterium P01_A01_bin.83]
MKLPSFRLQITLLSSALASVALIGFGAVSWWQIYRANLNRLDEQIINILMRGKGPQEAKSEELYQEHRWELYSNSLADILEINTKITTGLLVLDSSGNRLYQSESIAKDRDLDRLLREQLELTKPPPDLPLKESFRQNPAPPPPPPIVLTTESTITGTWRIGTVKFRRLQLAIAIDRQVIQQEMAAISNIFIISILILSISMAMVAWLLSRRAMAPIDRLTSVIQQVSVTKLDRRISLHETNEEFVELIRVFNQMMERLERSFYQSSRFSADAAHELKTPLTIIQGELERMLHQVEPGSEMQQNLGQILDRVLHLAGIMRKLLILSLADAGQLNLYLVEVNISELLWQILEDMDILAPHLSLDTNIAENLIVKGDRDLLTQVIQNLFSNAIKYNIADGWIEVIAQQVKSTVRVTIVNSSQDISISDREHLFERFYRGNPTNTHKIEGTGLGLNLAREIIRAHYGEIKFNSNSNGKTSFSVSLPMI